MMTDTKKKVLLLTGIALCAVGLAAWISQMVMGLRATTDMSNSFCWGLMIAVFAFLVGFGAGSQLVAGYIVLTRREHLMSYVPIAQALALAGALGAAVAVMADLGSLRTIMTMIVSPQVSSPLTWDMIALTCFMVVALLAFFASIKRSPRLRLWMVLGSIAAVALQVIEGLLFALQGSRLWWHSVLMPVDFLAVAVVCGLALALLIIGFISFEHKQEAMGHLRKLLAIAIGIHLVLSLADLTLVVLKGTAASQATIEALMNYLPLYAAELCLPAAALVLLCVWRRSATKRHMTVCSVLVIVGIFCHRLMLLYPAYTAPTLFIDISNVSSPAYPYPISTGLTGVQAFQMAPGYIPTAFEWASILLPIGLALIVTMVLLIIGSRVTDTAEEK